MRKILLMIGLTFAFHSLAEVNLTVKAVKIISPRNIDNWGPVNTRAYIKVKLENDQIAELYCSDSLRDRIVFRIPEELINRRGEKITLVSEYSNYMNEDQCEFVLKRVTKGTKIVYVPGNETQKDEIVRLQADIGEDF